MDLVTYDDYDWPPPTGEIINLKRKRFFWANRFNLPSILFGGAVTVFILLVIGFIPAQASAAESHADSVYFNSATDLIAKTDSVIGVCDTVMSDDLKHFISLYYQIHDHYGWRPYNSSLWVNDSSEFSITCRELVCVTVVEESDITIVEQIGGGYLGNIEHYKKVARGEAPPMPIDTVVVGHPGQAVIWWREVER